MNLPMYYISIPRFTFKNWKLRRARGTPKLLITPLFISFIKLGKLERLDDGGIVQNISLKSFMITDFLKLMFLAILFCFIVYVGVI